MLEIKNPVIGLFFGMFLLVVNGFGVKAYTAINNPGRSDAIVRHIAALKAGPAQQKAAAAYWLGQQKAAAAQAVSPLVELLGDSSQVDCSRYRSDIQKLTLGEEAAAALVRIGHFSIEPLIRVLKTSPSAEARKNAAWALGALHEVGATGSEL